MTLIKGKFVEDGAVNADKIKLQNNTYLKARNQADSADVDIVKVNASDVLEFASLLADGDKLLVEYLY